MCMTPHLELYRGRRGWAIVEVDPADPEYEDSSDEDSDDEDSMSESEEETVAEVSTPTQSTSNVGCHACQRCHGNMASSQFQFMLLIVVLILLTRTRQ